MIKRKYPLIFIMQCLICILIVSCGTLDSVGEDIYFPTSKETLEIAIDSLYSKYPEYKIPTKWESFNDWSARGYDFLESRIFYFNSSPEEMYYVTFIGDSTTFTDTTKIAMGIRAVNIGNSKWLLNNDLTTNEKNRIVKRFNNEIILKLEEFTKTKVLKY